MSLMKIGGNGQADRDPTHSMIGALLELTDES
jgi:hypothetical protein